MTEIQPSAEDLDVVAKEEAAKEATAPKAEAAPVEEQSAPVLSVEDRLAALEKRVEELPKEVIGAVHAALGAVKEVPSEQLAKLEKLVAHLLERAGLSHDDPRIG